MPNPKADTTNIAALFNRIGSDLAEIESAWEAESAELKSTIADMEINLALAQSKATEIDALDSALDNFFATIRPMRAVGKLSFDIKGSPELDRALLHLLDAAGVNI